MKPQFIPFPPPTEAATEERIFTAKTAPTPAVDCSPVLPRECQQEDREVQVSLVKDGERITAIRVRCGCGAVHELQCVY